MKQLLFLAMIALAGLPSCQLEKEPFDASGSFEADEITVSAELNGQLLQFAINEGDSLQKGQPVAEIDAQNILLQEEQVQANIKALTEKTSDVRPQLALLADQEKVQQSQLAHLLHEKDRTEKLVQADAATGKQLDDIVAQADVLLRQIAVTRQQIKVQQQLTGTQNRSILSEKSSLQKKMAQLDEQHSKAHVLNPTSGIVLTKYAQQGEIITPGKPLYKLADLSTITLKAYVTGVQLPQIKTGQAVSVWVDNGPKNYKKYDGSISWIAGKAEFTPKTIQTKEERASLVYAIKVRVKNDGFLKIGMYGGVLFHDNAEKK